MKLRVGILVALLVAPSVDHVRAQSCTSLPHGANELWLGAGVFKNDRTRWDELAFEAAAGRRFDISFRRVTGGLVEDEDWEDWGVQIGVPFGVGRAGFCILGGFEINDFSFEDRFDVDRGVANYLAREMGFRADYPVLTLRGVEVRGWIAPTATYLKFEASGRTLVVGDELSTEERGFGSNEWEIFARGGLTLRWKAVGISGGITRRPAFSPGTTLTFVRAGLALALGGSTRGGTT